MRRGRGHQGCVLLCGRSGQDLFDLSGEFATAKLSADGVSGLKLRSVFDEVSSGIENQSVAA